MSFKRKSALIRCAVGFLTFAIASASIGTFVFADETGISAVSSQTGSSTDVDAEKAEIDTVNEQIQSSFSRYLTSIADKPMATDKIDIDLLQAKLKDGTEKKEYNGKEAIMLKEEDWIEFTVDVAKEGVYHMDLSFCSIAYKGRDMQIKMEVDGKMPYSDAVNMSFKRQWKDKTEIKQDFKGNDLTPKQEEVLQWRNLPFKDITNFTNEEYRLYLTPGTHIIKLTMNRESMAVNKMTFRPNIAIPSYAEVKAEYDKKGYKEATTSLEKIKAETPFIKSDSMLIPTYDRSSPATEPYSVSKIKRNTIGQDAWSGLGMTISYKADVTEPGLYKIGEKYRQCYQLGVATSRTISIDGVVPFKEMQNVKYQYSDKWGFAEPTDENGNPCYVYLSAGEHIISFEATLGVWSEVLQEVDVINKQMNSLYRRIIMVTSAAPDVLRDYRLKENIPNLIEDLTANADALMAQANKFDELNEGRSSQTDILRRAATKLYKFAKKPRSIQEELGGMRSDISGISSWVNDCKKQPLELDYITVLAPNEKNPNPEASFFEDIGHFFASFFASFTEDYSNFSEEATNNEAIKVWIADGRDQVQIVKDLIDDSFTPTTGIPVNLSLIQGGIMEATLAGIGPDIALNQARISPVNYASRKILIPLDDFDTFDEVEKRFAKDALVPYKMSNQTYGIPTKQTFQLLFYRTDIFDELNLKVPNTWDDFYDVLKVLQRNNMAVKLPYSDITVAGIQDGGIGMKDLFATLFLQKGGTFYDESLTESRIDSAQGLAAFKMWTEFYTENGVDLTIDFNTRFRSGEVPMGIDTIEMYNVFAAVGSEIRGLWAMAPVPGTRREDGTIDRSVGESGGANVIFKSAGDRAENCWKFLDWFTTTQTQHTYGTQIENVLGVASRYYPANIEAFEMLPWTKSEIDIIREQRSYTVPIPEVPGAYFIPRSIDSAFRDVQNKNKNPRASWIREVNNINKELDRKNKELGTGKYAKVDNN